MRLELIDGIRLLIISFLVYVPTVSISGWFTAWIAKKCDDDLPERFGFLTFDPFAHFSLFGFSFMLIGEIFGGYLTFFKGFPGFGRFIILDPSPTNSKFKIITEFYARSFAHFLMLTISILMITLVFKGSLFVPSSLWTQQMGPLLLATKDLIFFFFKQNFILCVIYCLFGTVDIICFFLHIPRMFSMHYFLILIITLLTLSPIVEILLGKYIMLLQASLSTI